MALGVQKKSVRLSQTTAECYCHARTPGNLFYLWIRVLTRWQSTAGRLFFLSANIFLKGDLIMSKNPIFRGVATALVTPLNESGIDYEAFGRFVD